MISRTRASGWCSRIHLASHTIVRHLPEPWVCQMMPPSRLAMRVLRGLDAEVLVVAAGLLDARVEDDEVVDQLEQALLGAQLQSAPGRAGPRCRTALSTPASTSPACR